MKKLCSGIGSGTEILRCHISGHEIMKASAVTRNEVRLVDYPPWYPTSGSIGTSDRGIVRAMTSHHVKSNGEKLRKTLFRLYLSFRFHTFLFSALVRCSPHL